MMNARRFMVLMAVVVGLGATSGQAKDWWTGAVDDNWHTPNNWDSGEVPYDETVIIGYRSSIPNPVAKIYSGASGTATDVVIGPSSTGALTVAAGGTLTGTGELTVGDDYQRWVDPNEPFPIHDPNWPDYWGPGQGTLTVNGTITWTGGIGVEVAGRGQGTVHLNSGGLIEVTNEGGDIYIGKEWHYVRADDKCEFYHADGATLSIADNFLMATHHNQNDSFYKFVGGGVVTLGTDLTNFGNFNNWNGIVWVDGGTATINHVIDYGYTLFVNYSPTGQDNDQSGEGNDVPVLRFSGNNPLLKVNGLAAFTGAKLDLDANTLVIPGWQWVTLVDANSMRAHTDWQFATGEHDSNDLTFTASVDGNIWSMRTDNNKVQIKVSKRGDMDKDSRYTTDDINPFVLALTEPNGWYRIYGWVVDVDLIGDVNGDGKFNCDDISPFAALLAGGSQAIPEPATLSLLCLGAVAVIRRRRIRRLNR